MTVHKLVYAFAQNVKFEFSRIEKSHTMSLHIERLVNRIVMSIKKKEQKKTKQDMERYVDRFHIALFSALEQTLEQICKHASTDRSSLLHPIV